MSISKSKITLSVFSFLLALGLSLSLESLLAAWAPPNNYPPLDNVPAPITAGTSGSNQVINGDLGVIGNFMVGLQGFQEIGVTGVGYGLLLQNQDNEKNSRTWLGIAPSGTAQFADFAIFHNSDLTNYEKMQLGYDGSTNLFYVSASKGGTGTLRPLVFDATGVGSDQYKQLYLKTDGNVGIGTTDPRQKLVVDTLGATGNNYMGFFKGSSIDENVFWIGSDLSSNNAFGINWDYTSSGSTANHACMGIWGDDLGGAEGCVGLAIADGGKIGIGTKNPQTLSDSGPMLHVAGLDYNHGGEVMVSSSDNSQFIALFSGLQNSSTAKPTIAYSSNQPLLFGTWNNINGNIWSEKMRIDTDGFVGIGTTDPKASLHIENPFIYYNNSTNLLLRKDSATAIGSEGAGITFQTANELGQFGTYNTAGIYNLYDSSGNRHALALKVTGSGASTMNTVAYFRGDGNVGIGTAESNKLLHLYKDSGENAELDIQSVAGANNHWAIYQDRTTKDLNFWNNTPAGEKNILTIADDGYIEVGDGGIKFPDGTTQTTAAAGSSVPSGAVMSFNLSSCPSGWSELTSAKGRYIIGLPSGGTLAATVGIALSDQENRAVGKHNHNVKGQEGIRTSDAATVNRWFMYSLQNETSTDTGSVAGTNAPYIQLLICQKD